MKDDSPFEPNKEGVFFNLHEAVYRHAPGENISALKKLYESPLEYRYAIENPTDPTDDMTIGTILHFLTLQPNRDESECFVVSPFDNFKTKDSQVWRDSQVVPVITAKTLALIREAVTTIINHKRAGWILEKETTGEWKRAQTEVSVFKRHAETGLLLKGRADIVFTDDEGKTGISDIKKCQSVKRALFRNDIGQRLHHVAAAFYNDLFGASSFCFIPVKLGPPPDVNVIPLKQASMDRGREIYEKLLRRLVRCRAENEWPGVCDEDDALEEIEEPQWVQRDFEALP